MNAVLASIRNARRRAANDEGGYLLLYVLGIIGLTSVLVIALLGLALTSAKVAKMEAQVAKESRAADGALEAQISAISARDGEVCELPETRTVMASSVSPEVEVRCTPLGVADNGDAPLDGPDVEIVGTTPYAGNVPRPSEGTLTNPNLVVQSKDRPARFDSDVKVTGGAAPDRTDGGSPAVQAAGQYTQGVTVGGSGCGVLDQVGSRFRIQDSGVDGHPTCGTDPKLTVASPFDTSGLVRPLFGRNFDCSSGRVVLAPGSYSPADITALNGLLGVPSAATCRVVFEPGIHYLDVVDTSRTGPSRNWLTIANPRAEVVGGVESGAEFPRACEVGPGIPGVRIVLSARSAIRHDAGQVALCPSFNGDATLPALSQSSIVDTQPQMTSVTTPGATPHFGSADNIRPDRTDWAFTEMCGNWALGGDWFTGFYWYTTCPEKRFTTTWESAGSGPLNTARVLLDVRERPVLVPNSWPDTPASFHQIDLQVQFDVRTGAGATCSTSKMPVGRSYGESNQTMAYDLKSGSCATTLTDQAQFNGAQVTAIFSAPNQSQGLWLDVRDMHLETNVAALVGNGTPEGSDWTNPGGAKVRDGSSASVNQPSAGIPVTVWESAERVTRKFTLTGFGLAGSGLSPDDHVRTLGVQLAGPANEISYLADPVDGGSTTLTITAADGQTCQPPAGSATGQTYGQSNAFIRYDLIAGGCAGVVNKASQLEGAKVELSIRSGCATPQLPFPPAGSCSSVALPKVDQMVLVVGTDTYKGVTPYSSISVDTANHTSFDVFGPVELPKSDLDVLWKGTTYARPLFAGRLQVNGLGVRQIGPEQGSVCCILDDDVAVLVATVGGNTRAQAAIRVDPAAPGSATSRRPVEILSWKLCVRTGC